MLDYLGVFTASGIVLYKNESLVSSLSHTQLDALLGSFITTLIADSSILGRALGSESVQTFTKNNYTLKYWPETYETGLQVFYVAAYANLARVSQALVDAVVSDTKKLFESCCLSAVLDNRRNGVYPASAINAEKLAQLLDVRIAELEQDTNAKPGSGVTNTNTRSASPVAASGAGKTKSGKKQRVWGADGEMLDADTANVVLDYSGDSETAAGADEAAVQNLKLDGWAAKGKSGPVIPAELSTELAEILGSKSGSSGDSSVASAGTSSSSGSFLRRFIGGQTITESELQKAVAALQQHLLKKNIAPEVAEGLCRSASKKLLGSKTASWTSVEATLKSAIADSLRTLLTPNTSTNLLQDIREHKAQGIPYVVSVVGVNGVGKSTNLSKMAFWLLQNGFNVLIVACDTFRSGAVEQLKTHVRRLKLLTEQAENVGKIELFSSGYGGVDLVARIARDSIKFAGQNGFDVVLMDTAGRRHNDAHLMAPLESFAKAANPNKIVMVGEALVGTDSVMQARNFNEAFGKNRKLDFFIISKCDTVGDMIGSMVNMVYATGIPVLFVGTGQTYTDLRTLSVDWAVNMLMS